MSNTAPGADGVMLPKRSFLSLARIAPLVMRDLLAMFGAIRGEPIPYRSRS